jgi:2-polyprenyl-3-methyl-5-hydroxy-6-metoxy-1,4-benzoquinol methylase
MADRSPHKKKTLLDRLSRFFFNRRVKRLYAENDYLDAYRMHTDMRVERDPKTAIGGMWDEVGPMQLDFLVGEGLARDHRMLDIGCGSLRGGRRFIRHLDPEGYTGIDISEGVIEAGKRLVLDEGLTDKRPRLIAHTAGDLRFAMLTGESFDFLLAQSVFTHLEEAHIEECFRNVGRLMGPESRFYFTFYSGETSVRRGQKSFEFPFAFFGKIAKGNGFELVERSEAYPHPRGQRMAYVKKRSGPDVSSSC